MSLWAQCQIPALWWGMGHVECRIASPWSRGTQDLEIKVAAHQWCEACAPGLWLLGVGLLGNAGQVDKASLVLQWLKHKYGDAWQIDFVILPNLSWQVLCANNGGSNHRMARNISCVSYHHMGHYTGPWKASVRATQYSRKSWTRHWTPEPLGPKSTALSLYNTLPIVHQPLKGGMMSWTVKDHTKSSGWCRLQTLGYAFNQGPLVSQHQVNS